MPLSHIRLDPLPGLYQLRVYVDPVDTSIPLQQEMHEYCLVANLVISGGVATATLTKGEIPGPYWQELDQALAGLGVKEIIWERHKRGVVKHVKRKVKW